MAQVTTTLTPAVFAGRPAVAKAKARQARPVKNSHPAARRKKKNIA